MAANSANLPLPPDLMIKIFLLLPSKSIPTLELVSKQWMNLIKSPKYFNLYPNRSTAFFLGTNNLYSLLINHNQKLINFRNPPFTVHRIPTDLINRGSCNFSGHQLLNSVPINGVICIKSANEHFLIYNLFSEASFAVEDSPIQRNLNSCVCYGFGYDPYGDDYKIFVACKEEIETEKGWFWIYSFTSQDWKQFEGFPDYNWLSCLGYCFNGILHWVVARTRGHGMVMVTYDLRTRSFGEISLRNEDSRVTDSSILAELNGRLCHCYVTNHDSYKWSLETQCCVQVWVMKEYGVEESWEKWVSINSYISVGNVPRSWKRPSVVLEECEDGRKRVLVVCNYDAMLFLYEVDEKKKKKMKEVDEVYGGGGYGGGGGGRRGPAKEDDKKKMKVIVFWYNGMENKMGVLEEKDWAQRGDQWLGKEEF